MMEDADHAAHAPTEAQRPRVLSFGGGVQSSALVALLGRDEYPGEAPQEVWFCDPKNERPQTYEWIEQVIKPYCARIGIPFLTLERTHGTRGADLLAYYRRTTQYPLRTNRQCTIEWKVAVTAHECKRRAWESWEMHLGISLDELHRARTSPNPQQLSRYPLVEARLFRDDCARINQETFSANPVKSGCWFCKYQRPSQWREVYELRADGRWSTAVAWEREVMAKHGTAGAFIDARIGNKNIPLEGWAERWEAGSQLPMFSESEAACDGGYCMV